MPGDVWLIRFDPQSLRRWNSGKRAGAGGAGTSGECGLRADDFRPSHNVKDAREESASRGA